MKDDRLRQPIEPEYAQSLGVAIFCFAILEWNAVYCCERIQAGYINTVEKQQSTNIAEKLLSLAKKQRKELRDKLIPPAGRFLQLVKMRNDLVHGRPATGQSEKGCLNRRGKEWTVAMINDAADEFSAWSIELNALLYSELKKS
jgi:hypothetical protein